MFLKNREVFRGEEAVIVSNLGFYSLTDTFECGQAFRYERVICEDSYIEYMTVVGDRILRVGQRLAGELIFFGVDDEYFERVCVPYFSLDTDYEAIRADIISRTDSDWLVRAAESAKGIALLKQDPWETLFSFIISQNNNIPRIRKIIRAISAEYGENLAESGGKCPLGKTDTPCDGACRSCGICYSFPTAAAVVERPEGLLASHPGFRYKYLQDAAERVTSGKTDLDDIASHAEYEYTLVHLKEILGVGDKVASCVALFGFSNLEAFPIDVWMKRAIDDYFDGRLDHKALGPYAGVAQQYIFHYIRNLSESREKSK